MVSKWVQVCDLSHEEDEGDVPATESVTFQADGKTFALDLCNQHLVQWKAFEDQQAKWQRAARVDQAPQLATPQRSRVSDTAEHRKENAAIRDWAKTQPDMNLGDRGRIPDWVRQRYRDAMGAQARTRWDASEVPEQPVPVGATSG